MNKREELHKLLIKLLGSPNVYFQPPSTVKIKYPCIIYKRIRMDTKYADNIAYLSRKAYQITIIDPDADSELPGKVGALSLSRFDQHFTSDNLNHDVYNIYY